MTYKEVAECLYRIVVVTIITVVALGMFDLVGV